MQLSYSGGFKESAQQVAELEKAGLDLAWVAEAYGFDGVSLMGYLAAEHRDGADRVGHPPDLHPHPDPAGHDRGRASTPCPTAGATSASARRGRRSSRAGTASPTTSRSAAPARSSRSAGKVWAREDSLTHDGPIYHLPLPEGQGTGLGKPLKIIAHPVRPRIPIWIASLGPKNVEVTAEIADGWMPLFFHPEKAKDVWGDDLARGRAKRSADLDDLLRSPPAAWSPSATTWPGIRDLARPMIALYVGGMGAKGRNFYNDLVCRYGFEAEAAEIQDLYLAGKKQEAAAMVPEALLEATSLCGPEGYVKEKIAAFAEAGVTHLNVTPIPTGDQTQATVISQLKEWCEAV